MRFCKLCSRAMHLITDSGSAVYRCDCGTEEPGRPEDARIGGGTFGTSEIPEMHHLLIKNAPFDRTSQLVARDCPKCGRDYAAQVRVGDAETVIYKCKCGHESGSRETERKSPPKDEVKGGKDDRKSDLEYALPVFGPAPPPTGPSVTGRTPAKGAKSVRSDKGDLSDKPTLGTASP